MKRETSSPYDENEEILMWDEAEIIEVTPFTVKVQFIDDNRSFTREIRKENAHVEITDVRDCPRWHEFIQEQDYVAFFHEVYGWTKAHIISVCEA